MVQKDTRRRSNLILGVLLALLLGVAAGFFVLALPIRMLEMVTTFTRLSKLMVQAEPPISPNDRTLLAVLAGILTAGIGWVLIDWLLFGRAGMSTLIKPREDDYEDEDGDHFRPTDPLDLVSPVPLPAQDWGPPASGDARRPLSARTDIGDPPKPASPFGMPVMPQPGLDQPLNPFGQILPGVGTSAPPLHPNVPPPLQQPAAAILQPGQQPMGVRGTLDPAAPGAPLPTSWPPLDLSTPEPAMPVAGIADRAAPSAPGWLPVPGARPDGGQPRFDADEPAMAEPLAEPVAIAPTPVPPPLIPPPRVDIAAATAEPQPFFAPPPEPLAPPPNAFEPPVALQPVVAPAPAPVMAASAPIPAAIPAQPPAPAPVAPSSARPLSAPGFDKVRLEELLARLERGLQNRRAAAAAAPPPAPAAVAAPAPQPIAPAPVASRVEPPAAYAAPMPAAPPLVPIYTQPAAEPAPIFSIAPAQPPPVAPGPGPGPITGAPPPLIVPPPALSMESAARNDALLDQPLHVTLDLLRSMVKR